jgi:DNA polymerase III alpha subunit
MHKHIPIQIFSGAALGQGYNTAHEIAKHIKNNTDSNYFPLANTGSLTDVIEQELAAKEFGLKPLYARTLVVGTDGKNHLVVLAKNNAGRSWLNKQPEMYPTARDARDALLSSGAGVTAFVPHIWLDDMELSAIAVSIRERCDAALLYDVRLPLLNKFESLLHDWCVIPSLPVSYLRHEDKVCFELLRTESMRKTGPGLKKLELKGEHFYNPQEYTASFERILDRFPTSERTLQTIFDECTTTPLRLAGQEYTDTGAADAALTKKCLHAIELFLHNRDVDADMALQYRQRLERELSLAKEHKVSRVMLQAIDAFEARGDGVALVRGREVNCFVFYLFGLSLIDPVRSRLVEDLFFAIFSQNKPSGIPSFDFDCSATARQTIDEAMTDRHGEQYTRVAHLHKLGVKSVFRLMARHPVSPPSKSEIDDAVSSIHFSESTTSAQELSATYESVRNFFSLHPWAQTVFEGLVGRPYIAGTHVGARLFFNENPTKISPFMPKESLDEKGPMSIAVSAQSIKLLPSTNISLLGLRCLSSLNEVICSADADISSLHDIPLNDEAVWVSMRKNNLGLFNLESPGMFKCFAQAKLQTVDELAALLAMYRPGAIEHGLLDSFVSNTPYPMPDELVSNGEMHQILRETRGVPVYQDQLFEMMTRVAGLTTEQAAYWMDHMDELGTDDGAKRFTNDSTEKGVDHSLSSSLRGLLVRVGPYTFCKGHALSYATLSYMTGWLRHYHLNSPAFCNALNDHLQRFREPHERRELLRALLELGADIRGVDKGMLEQLSGMIVSNNVWYAYCNKNKLKLSDLK